MKVTTVTSAIELLRSQFGEAVQENAPMARLSAARIGGPADALVTVKSADELALAVSSLWQAEAPYVILGAGSNVLISDRGLRGVVVLNKAKAIRFETKPAPKVWAESGASFTQLANRTAGHGLAGMEWAAAIPGSVGGAIYGNAGAFGGETSSSLICAEVLTRSGREVWPVEKMEYGYRTSVLKRASDKPVILAGEFALSPATKEEVSVKIEQFSARRKATQPPGASMGSMFKNPVGDHAGRLIEAAGLKGTRIGSAEISTVHANFFINHGETLASDVRALIELARKTVQEKFGIALELEIELMGD